MILVIPAKFAKYQYGQEKSTKKGRLNNQLIRLIRLKFLELSSELDTVIYY